MSDVLGVTDPRRAPLLGGYPSESPTVGGGPRAGGVAGARRVLEGTGAVTLTGGGPSLRGDAERPDAGQPDRIRL